MKKYMFLFFLIAFPVNAKIVYIVNNNKKNITNNDNYNYKDYIIDKNKSLIVDKNNGILSNDIYNEGNIIILESSSNSHLKDLIVDDYGGFIYTPSIDVVGDVEFKYFIKSNDNSNISTINFYVNNTIIDYKINYYCDNKLIVPSTIKKASINSIITEFPIRIDGYYLVENKGITKKITAEDNNFNFYYISYIDRVNTGI